MRAVKHLLLAVAGFAQLFGCSGVQILDFVTPNKGYIAHKDIAYGTHARQKLDVYVPEKPDPSGGVILFFYGGSWQKGSKDMYRFVAQTFASRGYVTVIADYRLYPEVYYPAFVEDGAKALAWVYSHIGQYGGRSDNVFVTGHSAGGYMAVMLALNESFIKAEGGSTNWIRAAMGIAGPYDFLPFTDPNIQSIFSQVDEVHTQPITYATTNATPPLLLMSGDIDEDVGVTNTQHLSEKLRGLGAPVTEKVYSGVGHIDIVLALADGFDGRAPTLADMLEFIKIHSISNDR